MPKQKKSSTTVDVSFIEVQNIECEDDNIELIGNNNDHTITMYLDRNTEETHFIKFIKATERVIRSNKDYSDYLTYLREEEGLDTCVIFHNIQAGQAAIELHHFPFTLFTITSVIANKMLLNNKKVSSFILANEVIKTHFDGKVGIVPLTQTIHELAHLNKIPLLKKHIYGNYIDFYTEHEELFTDKEKI